MELGVSPHLANGYCFSMSHPHCAYDTDKQNRKVVILFRNKQFSQLVPKWPINMHAHANPGKHWERKLFSALMHFGPQTPTV
ncbi:hypothetical protein ACTXT7_001908 [Hymenolepis weldensis]